METHAGIGRIELQVKRRCLDGLLFLARQSGEAVGERIGDAKLHNAFRDAINEREPLLRQ